MRSRSGMEAKYIGIFSDKKSIVEEFALDEEQRKDFEDAEVLLAYYSYEDYFGEAFVLYRKNGNLFEVNGSHCSCYGLEYQWDPENVTVEELWHRVTEGFFGWDELKEENCFADELIEVLDQLKGA